MDVIWELMPTQTDTPEERDELVRLAQEYAKSTAEEDDFTCECPDDVETLEESDSTFVIDGKKKQFNYISSVNTDGKLRSFGQDALGLWWVFDRTSLTSGRNLRGPYRTKEKVIQQFERGNGNA